MLYADVHDWLGWPNRDQAFTPSGAGVRVNTEFARKKIQRGIEAVHQGTVVDVGVISTDSTSSATDHPLAVVCEFPRGVSDEVLDLTQKFAWNFSKTALLITLEPHRLIAWSCLQDPSQPTEDRIVCRLPTPAKFTPDGSPAQKEVRDLLHWVNLINNRVQLARPEQFPASGRADVLLLQNLRYVRRRLRDELNLAQEHCHDLLARLIFTQFLFHRKDSDGNAFFSERKMKRLQKDGTLKNYHPSLASVLTHKGDTYELFRWMDDCFNGDLFPGKDVQNSPDGHGTWSQEKHAVKKEHLDLLAGFVRGDLDAASQQQLLWPHYSFDTIPLEFISSVYEEFLTPDERQGDKAYYTPSHLVDYVLDAVLPWNSKKWDIRILDPCCGSAIFLVKAFQRLIHRWRLANKRDPLASDLRPILENNLLGIDKNSEAVRVACFSLYLAMADAIEPKHYITRDNTKVFPHLRGTRLIHGDFFDEEISGINSVTDAHSYDLVIGNAPWGDGSILLEKRPDESNSEHRLRVKNKNSAAQAWAQTNKWSVPNKDIGPVFLGKSSLLVRPNGSVAMLNTASLLYWRKESATKLRNKLFTEFTFEEITDLSALRRDLFAEATGRSCVVVFRNSRPAPEQLLIYYTPKPNRTVTQKSGPLSFPDSIPIEPYDISTLSHLEASSDPFVWTILAIGGHRDALLIRRLQQYPNIERLKFEGKVYSRMGTIPGNRKKTVKELQGRRYFDAKKFPESIFLELDASTVPTVDELRVDSGHGISDLRGFKNPQLLVKQSLAAASGRFRAALVRSDDPDWGVVCKETYLTISDTCPNKSNIKNACLSYNSGISAYFLSLTSSRLAHYIPEVLSKELITVPVATSPPPDLSKVRSFEDIDNLARKMFALSEADWQLVSDFLVFTLPEILRKTAGHGHAMTSRENETELKGYSETFLKVVTGTFGSSKTVSATIYSDLAQGSLPVRMITIQLGAGEKNRIQLEPIEADGLLDELSRLHADQLEKRVSEVGSGLGFQRVAFFFHPNVQGQPPSMNLTIVKPDQLRYWTRSMAMRDADQLAGAIATAAGKAGLK